MNTILHCTGHTIKYPDIVKGENCRLFDSSGTSYLDLESGVWCTSVGHSHPGISEVLSRQAGKIIHTGYCYLNPVVEECSKALLRVTGIKEGRCLFLSSGSEAVEFAVQVGLNISEKPYILSLKDSYLGAFGAVKDKTEDNWLLFDWLQGDTIDTLPFDRIGIFVFEPGSSSGQVRFPPAELIDRIVSRIRKHGGIIIANEVTTGIGRTGEWFGYNHYDLIPDIVAIGKGLGNGYPVSAVVIAEDCARRLDLDTFHYGQSHQNDPLGAAVALEVINIIEENSLISRSKEKGEEIRTRLEDIKERYGVIKEVRGRGLMIAIEFEKNNNLSFAEKINEALLEHNIILVRRPGLEIFRIDPALTIEDGDIDYFINTIESIIVSFYRNRHI